VDKLLDGIKKTRNAASLYQKEMSERFDILLRTKKHGFPFPNYYNNSIKKKNDRQNFHNHYKYHLSLLPPLEKGCKATPSPPNQYARRWAGGTRLTLPSAIKAFWSIEAVKAKPTVCYAQS